MLRPKVREVPNTWRLRIATQPAPRPSLLERVREMLRSLTRQEERP